MVNYDSVQHYRYMLIRYPVEIVNLLTVRHMKLFSSLEKLVSSCLLQNESDIVAYNL